MSPQKFFTSLEFRKNEATRHELGDILMILDAATIFCFAIYASGADKGGIEGH